MPRTPHQSFVAKVSPPGTGILQVQRVALAVLAPCQVIKRRHEPPTAHHPHSATLGGRIEVLGYELEAGSWKLEHGLRITLYGRVIQNLRTDYPLFAHVVDEEGQLVAQADVQPFDGAFPTRRWPVGAVVGTPLTIPLPADIPPGQYTVKVGLYQWKTLERLPVADDQSGENAVLLGPITVD